MEYYYIRNEGYLGNALIWWQEGGGYTCDIRKAEIFPEDKAKIICQRREDNAYKCKYIDEMLDAQKLIVDSQYIDDKERLWRNN